MSLTADELFPGDSKGQSLTADDLFPEEKKHEEVNLSDLVTGQRPETSSVSAFAKSAVESTLPTLAGIAAFPGGAAAGGAIAAPIAGGVAATGVGAPVGAAIEGGGALVGGTVAAMSASYLADKAQEKVLSKIPESLKAMAGMDQATRAREKAEHPLATFAGGVAASLVGLRPGLPNLKQVAAMAGLGGGLEAGREVASGEHLNAAKIGMAAAGGAVANKTWGVGKTAEQIGIQAALKALPKTTVDLQTKGFIAEAVKKNPNTPGILRTVPGEAGNVGVVQATKAAVNDNMQSRIEAKDLDDSIYIDMQNRPVDKIKFMQHVAALDQETREILGSEKMYHAAPEEKGEKLTPEEFAIEQKHIQPMVKENEQLYRKLVKMRGGVVADKLDPHNVRMLQDTLATRIQRLMDTSSGGLGYASTPGAAKGRTYFAVENKFGVRTVVTQNGKTISAVNKGSVRPRQHIAVTDSTIKPGETFQDKTGEKLKLTQATTKEIEEATGKLYSKNRFVNTALANLDLKASVRELGTLQKVMKRFAHDGRAVKVSDVHTEPKGYQRVDIPGLQQWYVENRMAEVFNKYFQHSQGFVQFLEKANNFGVGAMFYTPIGHLTNVANHWMSFVGWDLVKPWKYSDLIHSTFKAYKDVTKTSPEFLEMTSKGAALQMPRMEANKFAETIQQLTTPQQQQEMSKLLGYANPAEWVKGWYGISAKGLWGGGDIMMMQAYRYAAKQKHLDMTDRKILDYVETHMPSYRIPTRSAEGLFTAIAKPLEKATGGAIPAEQVGAVSGRLLSQFMSSRLVNTFGRYRYAQFHGLMQSMTDVFKQTAMSPQSRAEALSHLSFTMFNTFVVLPMVGDAIVEKITGDPKATMRRAGASTVTWLISEVLKGNESVIKMLGELWTPPPIAKAAMDVGNALKQPGSVGPKKLAGQVAGEFLPPVADIAHAAQGPSAAADLAYRQLGIKSPQNKEAMSQETRVRNAIERAEGSDWMEPKRKKKDWP